MEPQIRKGINPERAAAASVSFWREKKFDQPCDKLVFRQRERERERVLENCWGSGFEILYVMQASREGL